MAKYIDADALADRLDAIAYDDWNQGILLRWVDALKDLARIVRDDAPTVDAEPVKHGHWIADEDGNIECSECGHRGVGDDYCERCGAKMDEEN